MRILSFVLLLFSAVGTFAQSRPSVSVVGEAQIKVSPDQVVFTLEVITVNKAVTIAKHANDAASAKMLALAKEFQIEFGRGAASRFAQALNLIKLYL